MLVHPSPGILGTIARSRTLEQRNKYNKERRLEKEDRVNK
jgi:hypothetical protein